MKATIKGHITHTKYAWDDKPTFSFYTFDASDEHTVNVMEHEFEIEVPDDFDPRPGKIAALKEKKEKEPKKKLTIEAINRREMYLSNGKKYKKTSECATCDVCCFRPKRDADGNVYQNKCAELGLGYSKCGNYAWKRDKE